MANTSSYLVRFADVLGAKHFREKIHKGKQALCSYIHSESFEDLLINFLIFLYQNCGWLKGCS